MLSSTSVFLTMVTAAPLVHLVVRAAVRGEKNGSAQIRIAGIYCYYAMPLVGTVAAAFVALFVPSFLGVPGNLWALELLATGFQPAASTFAMSIAQANEDLRRFLLITSTSLAVNVVSKLYFVVWLESGILGWVISDLLAAVCSAVVAMFLVRVPRAKLAIQHVRDILRYCLPLIPHVASLVAIGFLSRPALAAVSTLAQVGIFSFALNLALFAGVILVEINRAFLGRYARERFPAPTDETRRAVGWQLVAAFVVPAIIGASAAIAGPWVFAADYWPSFRLAGLLLIGQAAYGLSLIPMNYLTQTGGVTKYSAVVSGSGTALILFSVLIFGHRYGALGLSYATAAGYSVMAIVAMGLVSAHGFDIAWSAWRVNWPEICLALTALSSTVAALQLQAGSTSSQITAATALGLSLGAIVLLRPLRPLS